MNERRLAGSEVNEVNEELGLGGGRIEGRKEVQMETTRGKTRTIA